MARLDKEIDKLKKDLQRVEGKLNNPKFVDKAPAEVVQKEKDKMADMQSALDKLEDQKGKIAEL
jgi:valyl-tRNA synthetase